MTFTDKQWARLKSPKPKKADTGDTLKKCSKCSFTSKYQTSVNRHEKTHIN